MERILVTRSSMPTLDEYVKEIEPLWDSHWLTNRGEKYIEFKDELRKYLDVNDIELFTNGHMALEMAVQSMDLKGEVITTPYTFISTTHAIVRNRLTPVFCDINPYDYTIDTSKIEALITKRTSAIVPVHVYGNLCDVGDIKRIADKYGLKVIYDAAHAFGESLSGTSVGTFGDVSCFSFHATKVFNTIEGGAACYTDQSVGKRLYELKNFGIHGEEKITGVGANAKMNEFCAAMGLCNLRHLDEEIAKRKKVYEYYMDRLRGVKGIKLNFVQNDVKSNYSYFPIVVDPVEFGMDRNELYNTLKEHGVFTRKYFYPISNECDCYKGKYRGDTPIAFEISQKILTLPMYADLSIEQIDLICNVIEQKEK